MVCPSLITLFDLKIKAFVNYLGMEYIQTITAKGEKADPLKIFQEYPQVITVVLEVTMHCEGCAQKIRRCILKMKGVFFCYI